MCGKDDGGCIGIRTLDRLIKSQMLYQLSYTPVIGNRSSKADAFPLERKRSGGCIGIRTLDRLIKSQMLYQLSYTPIIALHRGALRR